MPFTLRSLKKSGIDWHFTALQWKLGQPRTREQFLEISRVARFTVWSLAFQREGDAFRNAIHHLLAVMPSSRSGNLAAAKVARTETFNCDRDACSGRKTRSGMVGATGFEPVTSTV